LASGMRAAIITISTSLNEGRGEDKSGPALADWARDVGAEITATEIVPDEVPKIEWALRHYADTAECDLVLTTGGTGFAPSDVTPEATRAVIDREAPGVAEAMRAASRPHTAHWMLSRAVAGIRRRTLIVNFPGSPKSIREVGDEIGAAIPHAVALLTEQPTGHDRGR
jgi:molybdopterin adenylyltransferase